MNVFETPAGKFLCDMSLMENKSKFDGVYTFADSETIIDIIRANCGDQFADAFSKLLDDFIFLNTEVLYDHLLDQDISDDASDEAERLAGCVSAQTERFSDIYRISKRAECELKALTFGLSGKFKKVFSSLNEIKELCE